MEQEETVLSLNKIIEEPEKEQEGMFLSFN
jgi:hypothetical protein